MNICTVCTGYNTICKDCMNTFKPAPDRMLAILSLKMQSAYDLPLRCVSMRLNAATHVVTIVTLNKWTTVKTLDTLTTSQ